MGKRLQSSRISLHEFPLCSYSLFVAQPCHGFCSNKENQSRNEEQVTVQEAVTSLNRTEKLLHSRQFGRGRSEQTHIRFGPKRHHPRNSRSGIRGAGSQLHDQRKPHHRHQAAIRAHGRNADRPGRLRIRPSDRHQRTADYRCDGHDRRIPKRHTDRSRRDFRIDGGDLSRPTQHLLSGLHHTNRNNRARGESSAQHRPERV